MYSNFLFDRFPTFVYSWHFHGTPSGVCHSQAQKNRQVTPVYFFLSGGELVEEEVGDGGEGLHTDLSIKLNVTNSSRCHR